MATRATKTTRKPTAANKAKADEQYERFRVFAREHEADDDPEAFDHAFRKIVPPKRSS